MPGRAGVETAVQEGRTTIIRASACPSRPSLVLLEMERRDRRATREGCRICDGRTCVSSELLQQVSSLPPEREASGRRLARPTIASTVVGLVVESLMCVVVMNLQRWA
jgi:hypothetical protein